MFPEQFPTTLEGYNMQALYGEWSYAVPRAKGDITSKALAQPPTLIGFQPRGRLLEMVGIDYDLGPDAASDIYRMCSADTPGKRSNCITVLRFAAIPQTTWGGGPLTQWLERNFNPVKLVSILKARGIPPQADSYQPQTQLALLAMADPTPELKRLLEVRQIDSRSCPALAQATEQLEGRKIEMTVDLPATGASDSYPAPVNPHAYTWTYRLFLINDGGTELGGQGGTSLSAQLAQPFRDAAVVCGIRGPVQKVSAE
jgi:hypothetical protein